MMVKVLFSQCDYKKSIDRAKRHPLWESYKVKPRGFKLETNALGNVFIEAFFTTKSKGRNKNVELFECLFNSFDGFDDPAKITCDNASLEN